MATKKNNVNHAKTTLIRATSRCAVKIRDNYYTIEYAEERSLESMVDVSDAVLDAERQLLWDDCNRIVDEQIQDIVKTFQKSSKKR